MVLNEHTPLFRIRPVASFFSSTAELPLYRITIVGIGIVVTLKPPFLGP